MKHLLFAALVMLLSASAALPTNSLSYFSATFDTYSSVDTLVSGSFLWDTSTDIFSDVTISSTGHALTYQHPLFTLRLARSAGPGSGQIWFNHNRSPELAHDFRLEQISSENDLEFQFVRSVAIVNAGGIEKFLGIPEEDLLGT